jgi:hypothetical protein
MNNGSLVMDKGELFAQVSFKTPVDMDNQTGLLRTNSKYTESVFSGIYKFLTVDNEFRGGKFEQTCDLIRMPDDIAGGPLMSTDIFKANKTTSAERSPTGAAVTATEIINPPGLQKFDDGSSIQTFDDGSTLVTDTEGKLSSTPMLEGTADQTTPDEVDTKKLSDIVDSPTTETNYNDFDIEANNSNTTTPVPTESQAVAQEVQSQPSNTPRGRAIAEQQRVVDALNNDIQVYSSALEELQTNIDNANDAYDAAVASGNPAQIKSAQRSLQYAIDEKKNMNAKLKDAKSQIGEEEQKLKAI